MRFKTTVLLAAALALGLLTAGCGDDDDSGDSTGSDSSSTISKQDFLTQANEVCKEGDEKVEQAFNSLNGQTTGEQADKVVTDDVVPAVQGQIDGIRALGAPSGEETQVNAILDAAQKANDAIKADPSSITSGSGPDPFAEANQLAAKYGLKECAG